MILEFSHVSKGFGETSVLRDLTFAVAEGKFVVILGFSGSGKTTLMNLMAGLTLPVRGAVRFRSADVTGPGPERGMVFQSYALMPWLNVAGNTRLAVNAIHKGNMADREAEVARYVQMVGLGHAADRRLSELSGECASG